MIQAKVIADSKNEFGNRITTMVVTMPRIILAEFNTHRMFSRNSASSRAIPFEKMIKSIKENPFIPIAWQKDHKGMQGIEYITKPLEVEYVNKIWLNARDSAANKAKMLSNGDTTKQLCNRLLEPFMWHTVICTSTEWENFFALRCPQYNYSDLFFKSKKDSITYRNKTENTNFKVGDWDNLFWLQQNKGQAEIHMMELAEQMWDAYNESIPKELKAGEWHIPFEDKIDESGLLNLINNEGRGMMSTELNQIHKIKIATARCARISYTVVGEEGKEPNYENDIKLHDKLLKSGHASPTEHIAQAITTQERSRNFTGGWKQYREILDI